MSARLWLCLALLAAAGEARADAQAPWGLHEGFYLAPTYMHGAVDVERGTDDGEGQAVALGYRWGFTSLEARYMTLALPRSDGDGDAEVTATLVGVQLAPMQDLRIVTNVYSAFNVGRVQRKNHPGFARDGDGDVVEAGLGNLFPFELFGFGFAARVEALYRLETPDPPREDGEPRKFEDYVLHVGLQARIAGRRPAATAAAAPDAPPAAPALVDSDDDGVIDELDRCPETPPESLVNSSGCVPG